MRAIFVGFLVLGVASTAAIRLLPWWSLAALFGGLVLAALVLTRWILPRLLPRILKTPFRAKGAVLRGASVHMHAVERAPAPPAGMDREEEAISSEPADHYEVELTITPRPTTGAFGLWEPDELRLAGSHEDPEEPDSDEAAGKIWAVQVKQDGRFQPASGMKYGGPQRLRLLVSAPRSQRRVRLRYYFELFGEIALPAGATSVNGAPAPLGRSPFAKAR